MPIDPSTAFISYSRDDLEFVLRLAKSLRLKGAKVWMDKLDIRPGQRWEDEIQAAVDQCSRMLIVLSPSATLSKNVSAESSFAIDEGKEIIPVFYRQCKIPFRLRPFQYADFRDAYEIGIDELLGTLLGITQDPETDVTADQERLATESTQASADEAHQQKERRRGDAPPRQPPRLTSSPTPPYRNFAVIAVLVLLLLIGVAIWRSRTKEQPQSGSARASQPGSAQSPPPPPSRSAGGSHGAAPPPIASPSKEANRLSMLEHEPVAQMLGRDNEWGRSGTTSAPPKKVKLELVHLLKNQTPLEKAYGIAFSPDGKLLGSAWQEVTTPVPLNFLGNGRVHLWDVTTGALVRTLVNPSPKAKEFDQFAAVAFSPDGRLVAASTTAIGPPSFVQVWEARSGKALATMAAREGLRKLAFSPNGVSLAAACDDGSVHIWETSSGKLLRTLKHPYIVASVAFNPLDNGMLAAGDYSQSVRIWNLKTGTLLKVLRSKPASYGEAVAFSRSGTTLATGHANGSVILWNVVTWKMLRTIHLKMSDGGAAGGASLIAFTPDDQLLAVTSDDSTLRFFDPQNGSLVGEFDILKGEVSTNATGAVVAFNPRERMLATTTSADSIRIWKLTTD